MRRFEVSKEERLSKIAGRLGGSDYAILDKINTSPGFLKNSLIFGGVDKLIKIKLIGVSIEYFINQEKLFLTSEGAELLSFIDANKSLKKKLVSKAMASYLEFRETADLGKNLREAFRRCTSSAAVEESV